MMVINVESALAASAAANTGQQKSVAAAGFAALMVGQPLYDVADELLNHIVGARAGDAAGAVPQASGGFTELFAATFGLSGPLPAFITRITAKLGLSAAQNQALQTIAVHNKDMVKTPASVQKLALELKQAGIGV